MNKHALPEGHGIHISPMPITGDDPVTEPYISPVSIDPPTNVEAESALTALEAQIGALKASSTPTQTKAACLAVAAAITETDEDAEGLRAQFAALICKKVRAENKAERDRIRTLCTPATVKAAEEEKKSLLVRTLEGVNARFALAEIGNGLAFIKKPDEPGGEPKIWDAADFRLALKPEKVVEFVGGEPREKPVSEVWEEWPGRDYYAKGCVFEPGEETPGAFNLFTGWPVLAREPQGSWKGLRRHLFNNVCNRDKHAYRWLLVWLAEIVQRPSKKSGTALVLRGEQGVGKSFCFDKVMPKLLGRYAAVIGDRDSIGARFNAEHQGKLLVVFEEALFAGDYPAVQALKHMITGTTRRIEPKGVDAFFVSNHARFVLVTNEEQAIKADLGERRYAVFEVSTRRQRDKAYFAAIVEELEAGGYAAMFDDLMNLDAGRYLHGGFEGLRDVPETDALLEQKMMNMSAIEERLIAIIRDGRIGQHGPFLSDDEPTNLPVDKLMEHLRETEGLHPNDARNLKPAKVRRLVERLWGVSSDTRDNVMKQEGKSYRYWTIPPLTACRERLRGLGLAGFLDEPPPHPPAPPTVSKHKGRKF